MCERERERVEEERVCVSVCVCVRERRGSNNSETSYIMCMFTPTFCLLLLPLAVVVVVLAALLPEPGLCAGVFRPPLLGLGVWLTGPVGGVLGDRLTSTRELLSQGVRVFLTPLLLRVG